MANLGDASDTSTVLQRFSNRISSWFRSFSQCFGGCCGGSDTDNDQLLRNGPSHSNQGNLLKGIVIIWLVLAQSGVQSPERVLDSNLSNTFS